MDIITVKMQCKTDIKTQICGNMAKYYVIEVTQSCGLLLTLDTYYPIFNW